MTSTRRSRLLDQAEARYLRGFSPDVRPIPAMRAQVHLAQGLVDEAWNWAHEHQVTSTTEPAYLKKNSTCSRTHDWSWRRLALDGSSTAVEGISPMLGRLLPDAESCGRGGSVLEILVVRSMALEALGNRAEALDALARAVVAGVPAGFVRLFLDEGEPLQSLLGDVGRRPGTTEHVRALRVADSAAQRAPTTVDGPDQTTLSDRELEVLRLLATTLSGPEIARQLFVSVNTLRSHTKHIFTKLDVNTRATAVSRAEDLGLLDG